MADSTIDGIAPGPAWAERTRTLASTLTRSIRPAWIVAATIIGLTALGVVAAQTGAAQLEGERRLQVERTASLESALRTQQLLDARAAVQVDDLRARAAEQLAALGSTEGLLK